MHRPDRVSEWMRVVERGHRLAATPDAQGRPRCRNCSQAWPCVFVSAYRYMLDLEERQRDGDEVRR